MGKTKDTAKAIGKADRDATHHAARHRDAPAIKATGFLAEIADQPQLITLSIATALIGLFARKPALARGGARMLAAHLAATGVKSAIKHSIDRTRPARAIEDGAHRFEPGHSGDHELNSFPSGHTAGAVAVSRAIARDMPGAAAPAALATVAVAAAQPVNGSHYFSDLVAGAAVGWATEALVSAVFDRLVPVIDEAVPALPGRDGPDGRLQAPVQPGAGLRDAR
ncbi:phosphatase PAP2 family protein [Sphingomonas sp.]|jgi:membrane-associated phospholipid phosphatase|uniref:phosphatase PAP2 family protein n=1 Tax=Sphingomonas sp. TaxID=28214 RepID=UPI002EDB79F7